METRIDEIAEALSDGPAYRPRQIPDHKVTCSIFLWVKRPDYEEIAHCQ